MPLHGSVLNQYFQQADSTEPKVAVVKGLEDAGFPTLYLEFDVTVPIGPFRIRVEAFLETLGSEDLF